VSIKGLRKELLFSRGFWSENCPTFRKQATPLPALSFSMDSFCFRLMLLKPSDLKKSRRKPGSYTGQAFPAFICNATNLPSDLCVRVSCQEAGKLQNQLWKAGVPTAL
jgi:hypothetical protein